MRNILQKGVSVKLLTSHMLTKYNENGFASIKQSLIKVCNPTIVYYNMVSINFSCFQVFIKPAMP